MKKDPRVYSPTFWSARKKSSATPRAARKNFTTIQCFNAVIRNSEIIGEAAKRVPKAYCRAHSQIRWRLMAGFRDVLIHAYEGIDLKRVWQIVGHDLPVVKEAVEKLLPPLEELEKELAEPETDKEKAKK